MSELELHLGETAELYAAGALDELESARVQRHAATCVECARRLGEAEATVLQLIEAGDVPAAPSELDRRVRVAFAPRRSATAWVAAVAAAFVLGLLPWAFSMQRERDASVVAHQQQLATVAMLNGHFLHAPFVPLTAGAPAAKAIYARDGGWLYVIVGPGTEPVDVAVVSAGKRTIVATLPASNAVRTSFLNPPQRAGAMELLSGGSAIARARIVYAAPKI